MGRRKKFQRRDIIKDRVYKSEMIGKFINKVMLRGKKSLAERIVYGALEVAREELGGGKGGDEIFMKALDHSKPLVQVRSKRVGGATYQVPVEIKADRQTSLAMSWLVKISRGRSERSMVMKLSHEIIDAYNNVGKTIKKKEEAHKMAEANRAFSHFKW